MTRILLLLMLGVVALAPTLATAADRPNIVLIFTDDQGYQDLGCFGSPTIKTPHLDRMATEGVRLTSFYAQPVCGVSRAALMTGSYPVRVAEPGNVKRLHTVPHSHEVTMAEVLKQAGYATGIIGKWHLALDRNDQMTSVGPATMPNAQGFDYFYGTPRFNGYTVLVNDTKMRSPIMRKPGSGCEGSRRLERYHCRLHGRSNPLDQVESRAALLSLPCSQHASYPAGCLGEVQGQVGRRVLWRHD